MFTVTCSAPWTHSFATFAEKFFIGTTMALVGISIVFIVLALLSLFVQLISYLIRLKDNQPAGKPAQAEPLPEPAKPAVAAAADDPQVIAAVIAAAVAAYTNDQAPGSAAGFTIRRVRRV